MDNTSPLMLSVYDFFKDQGSAFTTFLAVIAALGISIYQTRSARKESDRQIRALKAQIDQTAALEKERNAAHQRDLVWALGIEAARLRALAYDRLSVASLQSEASLGNLVQGNPKFHDAFKIHTTSLMQHGQGIAQFDAPLTSSISACLASVDQLNSLIDVKIGFGQFRVWKELIAALEKVRENADTVLTHTALTEEKLKKMWDVP
jgi:hypothetical protein